MKFPDPWRVCLRLINGEWKEDFIALVRICHGKKYCEGDELGVMVWGSSGHKNERFRNDDIWKPIN